MIARLRTKPAAWCVAGLVVAVALSLLLSGHWPQTPLGAVATDRIDTFAVATGPVDDEVEAVYFLDFLTGDLRAAVLGRSNKFQGLFQRNVLNDFQIPSGRNPKFMIVTGMNRSRKGSGMVQFAQAVLYVSEITSGKCVAYAIPWPVNARTAERPLTGELQPLDVVQFRNVIAPPAGG